MKVAFLWPFLPEHEIQYFLERLSGEVEADFGFGKPPPDRPLLPDVDVIPAHERSLQAVAEADVIIGSRFDARLLAAARRARIVIIPFAGILDHDRQTLQAFPYLKVCNSHYNAPFVAEHAMALLLAVAKRILPYDRALRQGLWQPPAGGGASITLRGKTLGLLGYGAIGRHVAELAQAFGMRIEAIRRTPLVGPPPPPLQFLGTSDHLKQVLNRSDYVIVALELTAETEGFLGAEEFSWVKPSSVLANVARGTIVQEEPFYNALVDGRLAGAGIDTWYNYPPQSPQTMAPVTYPSRFPFWELPNVVLSPHRAADAAERNLVRLEVLAEELNWLAAGNPPHNVLW